MIWRNEAKGKKRGLLPGKAQAPYKRVEWPSLAALRVQHIVFSCVTEEIGSAATKGIHLTVDSIIQGVAEWVRNESKPAKGMVIDGRSGGWV
jgi:hypothetical protein